MASLIVAALGFTGVMLAAIYFNEEKCPKGGLHEWQPVGVSAEASDGGKVSNECKKCETREVQRTLLDTAGQTSLQ